MVTAPNIQHETVTLSKFDLMDGSPVKGEVIPVRLFLGGNPGLTPTYRNVYNKFSVKYFLNLVIVDENGRRFFKQQEIVLWRKAPLRVLKSSAEAQQTAAPAAAAVGATVLAEENSQEKEFPLPTPRAVDQSPQQEDDKDTQETTQTKMEEEKEGEKEDKEEEKEEVKNEESKEDK